ncbi:14922_t:CDS:2 [Funneliformis caledonium]|uniref:14922_t:CDS:1 n=1 Tax=Funneliformis caledonium TaxID=1117310 RepID=A0A9N8ZPY9_9GLOM|nr:14922_t:CDS:2 [Funneliformis caledonium]
MSAYMHKKKYKLAMKLLQLTLTNRELTQYQRDKHDHVDLEMPMTKLRLKLLQNAL